MCIYMLIYVLLEMYINLSQKMNANMNIQREGERVPYSDPVMAILVTPSRPDSLPSNGSSFLTQEQPRHEDHQAVLAEGRDSPPGYELLPGL